MNASNTRRNSIPSGTTTIARATMTRGILALACALPLLTACYVVPVHPDGRVYPPTGTQGAQATMVMPATVWMLSMS